MVGGNGARGKASLSPFHKIYPEFSKLQHKRHVNDLLEWIFVIGTGFDKPQ